MRVTGVMPAHSADVAVFPPFFTIFFHPKVSIEGDAIQPGATDSRGAWLRLPTSDQIAFEIA
jgi:hypothetical protein